MSDTSEALEAAALYALGMKCGRCDEYTGNNSQGHYWAWCSVARQMEDHHFCCPGDCELHPDVPDSPIGGARQ